MLVDTYLILFSSIQLWGENVTQKTQACENLRNLNGWNTEAVFC